MRTAKNAPLAPATRARNVARPKRLARASMSRQIRTASRKKPPMAWPALSGRRTSEGNATGSAAATASRFRPAAAATTAGQPSRDVSPSRCTPSARPAMMAVTAPISIQPLTRVSGNRPSIDAAGKRA